MHDNVTNNGGMGITMQLHLTKYTLAVGHFRSTKESTHLSGVDALYKIHKFVDTSNVYTYC